MTVSALKKALQLGVKVKLIAAPMVPNHKFLNVVREVTKVRSRCVAFGKSY